MKIKIPVSQHIKGLIIQNWQTSEKYVNLCSLYLVRAPFAQITASLALLRFYGNRGCFNSGHRFICIVGTGVSHLPLDSRSGQASWLANQVE